MSWAAWWSNDAATLFPARERAFNLYRRKGNTLAAARMAIWLGSDYHDFRGEDAVANGWYQRARRLLADVPAGAEHGWLSFQEGAYALELNDDTATACRRATEVVSLGRRLGLSDLEFLGLGLEGLALVTEGEVEEGLRRLDEVGVAATAGEMTDRIAVNWMLCYLIYACERVRDFDRTAQWCLRVQEMTVRFGFDLGTGMCRAHYGGVLVYHGRWDLAESELLAASDILARTRPLAVAESAVRLAELRRRQGRVAEAGELFEQAVPHPLAIVGLANLALDTADAERASEMLEDLLEAIPTASITQQADVLSSLTRARAALGDEPGARAGADALDRIAVRVGTKPLRAMASWARAGVATVSGDRQEARRRLEEAVELFERSGMPYESGCVLIELAGVLTQLQRADAADRHARRAAERLRALGALYAAQRAEQVGRAAGDPAAGDPSPLAVLSRREVEVLTLLAEGLSDREIGQRLTISAHTVHRHVSNLLAKLGLPTRAAAAAVAGRVGLSPAPAPAPGVPAPSQSASRPPPTAAGTR